MITIQWLKSAHPSLPKHIKDKHGHLFTPEKPNWADLQPDFVSMMDTFLAELEAKDDDDPDARIRRVGNNFRDNYRGRGGNRGRGFPRGGQRESLVPRVPQSHPGKDRFCDICHAAGKPELVVNSHNMPWCKALSTHGKRTIVSSVRMAFVGEIEDEADDATAELEEVVDESLNPYENI